MASPINNKISVENLLLQKNLITQEQLEKAKNIQSQTLEKLEDIIGLFVQQADGGGDDGGMSHVACGHSEAA